MADRRPKHQIKAPDVLLEQCLKFYKAEAAAEAAAAAAETHLHPQKPLSRYRYPSMHRNLGSFRLHVAEGEITDSQIIAVLGKKGTRKSRRTIFLQMLAETMERGEEMPKLNVSYKPQKLRKYETLSLQTVGFLLDSKIHDSCMNPEFVNNVMEPLHINLLMDKLVKDLLPAQRQSVALCLCLGKPADIYLIDEPSAYLSQRQCEATTKVIKWFIRHERKAAFVADDDLIMAFELAHRYIVIEEQPFVVDCHVNSPVSSVSAGLNLYLNQLDDDEDKQRMVNILLGFKQLLDITERSEQEAAESSSSSYDRDQISGVQI